MWSAMKDADGRGWLGVAANRADKPAGRLSREVGTLTLGVGSNRTEGAALGANDARVELDQVIVADTPGFESAGLEIANENVGVLGEHLENAGPAGMPEIQGNAALAPVAGRVDGAAWIVGADVDVTSLVA